MGLIVFLLADPYALEAYQIKHGLGENLQTSFTTTSHGDNVIKQGAMICLSEIQNEGHSIFFNFTGQSQMADFPDSNKVRHLSRYTLSVIRNSVSLLTWPYLEKFNQAAIEQIMRLSSSAKPGDVSNINGITYIQHNTVRQTVPAPNGHYTVDAIFAYIENETPAFEFVFNKT